MRVLENKITGLSVLRSFWDVASSLSARSCRLFVPVSSAGWPTHLGIAADNHLWPSVKATFKNGHRVLDRRVDRTVIGLLMGMSRVVNSCLKSLFLGLQTLPTAAWARFHSRCSALASMGSILSSSWLSARCRHRASDGIPHSRSFMFG